MPELISNSNWTRVMTVVVLVTVRIMLSMVMSLQAPFFPGEAEEKGLGALEYGMIFGCYELFSVMFGPIVERLAKWFPGPRVLFLGTMTLGGSTCAFGFLDKVYGHWTFFSLSILIRLVEAFGATASYIMSSAVLYQEFPTRMATVSAIMETCNGVGTSIGPAIGGPLFQVGGFTLPFLVVGIAVSVTGAVGACVMPKPRPDGAEDDSNKSRPSIFGVLKIRSVLLRFSAITICNLCLGGLAAILEPYLRKFNLTTMQVSLMFVAYTGTYTIFGLFWGIICDRIADTNVITLIGLIVSGIGYSCSGPISDIPGKEILGLGIVASGLVLTAIGINAVFISTMIQIAGGIKKAYPGDDHVYTTVSGLVSTGFCLGGFLGPIAAGSFVDFLYFSSFFYFCIALHVLLIVSCVYSIASGVTEVSTRAEDENSTLIQSDQNSQHH